MSKLTSVDIIQAQNLKAADLNGKSDPYVIFYLRDGGGRVSRKHRTRTIKKNLNPYWDENFVCDSNDTDGNLIFEVWDYDTFSHDDMIGSASWPMSDLKKQSPYRGWISLVPCGRLEIRVNPKNWTAAHAAAPAPSTHTHTQVTTYVTQTAPAPYMTNAMPNPMGGPMGAPMGGPMGGYAPQPAPIMAGYSTNQPMGGYNQPPPIYATNQPMGGYNPMPYGGPPPVMGGAPPPMGYGPNPGFSTNPYAGPNPGFSSNVPGPAYNQGPAFPDPYASMANPYYSNAPPPAFGYAPPPGGY